MRNSPKHFLQIAIVISVKCRRRAVNQLSAIGDFDGAGADGVDFFEDVR